MRGRDHYAVAHLRAARTRRVGAVVAFALSIIVAAMGALSGEWGVVVLALWGGVPGGLVTFHGAVRRWPKLRGESGGRGGRRLRYGALLCGSLILATAGGMIWGHLFAAALGVCVWGMEFLLGRELASHAGAVDRD